MSAISEMIKQLEREAELRNQAYEREAAENEKAYEKMKNRVNFFKEETQKQMQSIEKKLDKLVANKHTIEKALEKTENLHGLTIPYDQHGAVVDLVSKMAESLNNIKNFNSSTTFAVEQIHQDAVTVSEIIGNDLKECHTEVSEAQSLYHNSHMMDNLIRMDRASESTEMNGSLFDTIN